MGTTKCNSETKSLTSLTEILFDEHHVIPINRTMTSEVLSFFMDGYFEIQVLKLLLHLVLLFLANNCFSK